MTLEAIKEAIEQLPPEQQTALASWLSWDQQIARDFSPGGPGVGLLEDLEREIAAGKSWPVADGLAERRKLQP